ncbi:hypothetical protein CRG98_044430 [Punica granatum]|uniref:Knottins-like domain-containing protein n=1 Tax=Punica granatum TaxID=22663 RepID=A0A2I0HTW5_PUNGR|nr:hypothetical protein CRG98_044430 [Punica granatum]
MAKQLANSFTRSLVPVLLMSLFLVFTEMPIAEARVCQRLSTTWLGFCGNSGNCDRQCREREGALHGACHTKFPGVACFCYFRASLMEGDEFQIQGIYSDTIARWVPSAARLRQLTASERLIGAP